MSLPEVQIEHGISEGKYKKIVFILGAGVSVQPGLSDFRSEDGLYNKVEEIDPTLVSCPYNLFNVRFWSTNQRPLSRYLQNYYKIDTKPTEFHKYLVELQHRGQLLGCITQNFDDLEAKAGVHADKIVQLHGNINTIKCSVFRCPQMCDFETYKESLYKEETLKCKCGGIFRPDIIMFNQPMKLDVMRKARELIKNADLLLVVGTSLSVATTVTLARQRPEHVPCLIVCDQKVEATIKDSVFHQTKCEDVFTLKSLQTTQAY